MLGLSFLLLTFIAFGLWEMAFLKPSSLPKDVTAKSDLPDEKMKIQDDRSSQSSENNVWRQSAPVPQRLAKNAHKENDPNSTTQDHKGRFSLGSTVSNGNAALTLSRENQLNQTSDLQGTIETSYPSYEELSPEMKQQISPLEMSLHFYTESPEQRLVRVNGLLLREGDWLTQDIRLVEIKKSSAVFIYLNHQFQLPSSRH